MGPMTGEVEFKAGRWRGHHIGSCDDYREGKLKKIKAVVRKVSWLEAELAKRDANTLYDDDFDWGEP